MAANVQNIMSRLTMNDIDVEIMFIAAELEIMGHISNAHSIRSACERWKNRYGTGIGKMKLLETLSVFDPCVIDLTINAYQLLRYVIEINFTNEHVTKLQQIMSHFPDLIP